MSTMSTKTRKRSESPTNMENTVNQIKRQKMCKGVNLKDSFNDDHFSRLSVEIMCQILKLLPLKDVLRMESVSKKVRHAVLLHLKLKKDVDFSEDNIYGTLPEGFCDEVFDSLVKKCASVQYIYNFHPRSVVKRKLRCFKQLSLQGITDTLSKCSTLEGIELSNVAVLEAILTFLPHLKILGIFRNRGGTFPIDSSNKLTIATDAKITSLHLTGVAVPELPCLDSVKYIYLQFVRFTNTHPFREFGARMLNTFVMSHCAGPTNALKYIPLLTALSECKLLTRLEVQRIPLLGELVQHIVEDAWKEHGFCGLKKLLVGACKHMLETDLAYLMIASSRRLEEAYIQPSLTRDTMFTALKLADVDFPNMEKLSLGFVDAFPDPKKWTNQMLVEEGLADVQEFPAVISDVGMKAVGECFPLLKTLEVSKCPHLQRPTLWITVGMHYWYCLRELFLECCHTMNIVDFGVFLSLLPSLEDVRLSDMFKELPRGCARVGLSAGTGLGVSGALVANAHVLDQNQNAGANQNAGNNANQNQNIAAANNNVGNVANQNAVVPPPADHNAGNFNVPNHNVGNIANHDVGNPANQNAGNPANQNAGNPANQNAGNPVDQNAGNEANQDAGIPVNQNAENAAIPNIENPDNPIAGNPVDYNAENSGNENRGNAVNEVAGNVIDQNASNLNMQNPGTQNAENSSNHNAGNVSNLNLQTRTGQDAVNVTSQTGKGGVIRDEEKNLTVAICPKDNSCDESIDNKTKFDHCFSSHGCGECSHNKEAKNMTDTCGSNRKLTVGTAGADRLGNASDINKPSCSQTPSEGPQSAMTQGSNIENPENKNIVDKISATASTSNADIISQERKSSNLDEDLKPSTSSMNKFSEGSSVSSNSASIIGTNTDRTGGRNYGCCASVVTSRTQDKSISTYNAHQENEFHEGAVPSTLGSSIDLEQRGCDTMLDKPHKKCDSRTNGGGVCLNINTSSVQKDKCSKMDEGCEKETGRSDSKDTLLKVMKSCVDYDRVSSPGNMSSSANKNSEMKEDKQVNDKDSCLCSFSKGDDMQKHITGDNGVSTSGHVDKNKENLCHAGGSSCTIQESMTVSSELDLNTPDVQDAQRPVHVQNAARKGKSLFGKKKGLARKSKSLSNQRSCSLDSEKSDNTCDNFSPCKNSVLELSAECTCKSEFIPVLENSSCDISQKETIPSNSESADSQDKTGTVSKGDEDLQHLHVHAGGEETKPSISGDYSKDVNNTVGNMGCSSRKSVGRSQNIEDSSTGDFSSGLPIHPPRTRSQRCTHGTDKMRLRSHSLACQSSRNQLRKRRDHSGKKDSVPVSCMASRISRPASKINGKSKVKSYDNNSSKTTQSTQNEQKENLEESFPEGHSPLTPFIPSMHNNTSSQYSSDASRGHRVKRNQSKCTVCSVDQACQVTSDEIRQEVKDLKNKNEKRQSKRRRYKQSDPEHARESSSSPVEDGPGIQSGSLPELPAHSCCKKRRKQSVTCNKSTSTSDPVLEGDVPQSLKVCNVRILQTLVLHKVGITDLVLDGCPVLQNVTVSACPVLRQVSLGSCSWLHHLSFSQCKKLDEAYLLDQIRKIPIKGPMEQRHLYLRPMHPISELDLWNEFIFKDSNYGSAFVFDYSPLPSETAYNKDRIKEWTHMFNILSLHLVNEFGFRSWKDMDQPNKGLYFFDGKNENGSDWRVFTDIAYLEHLDSYSDMPHEHLQLEDRRAGVYCPNKKGHYLASDLVDDVQPWLEDMKDQIGLHENFIIVYFNMSDVSGIPANDPIPCL